MAWPASTDNVAGVKSSFDKTANTWGRSVDQFLWPALMARSPLLSMLKHEKTENVKYEWENQVAPTRTFTSTNSTNTTIDGSADASNNAVEFSSATGLQKGDLLRNISRATPVGTYGADEVMQVTAISGNVATVTRDYQRRNSGNGSAVHASTDVFEVIGTAREEGSKPEANRYTDVSLTENYTQIFDYYLTVTGSQLASKRLVGGDTVEAQTKMGVQVLANELEKSFLYGAVNYGSNGSDGLPGSASYVRTSKGFQQYVQIANGNVDYTTKVVTETALNKLVADILEDKTDPMDKFIIVCHPQNARVISHFGEDTVRVTRNETVWGRQVQAFLSDLGVELEILWTLNCSKSDLFIIDLNKVSIVDFRPWMQTEWTYASDGIDAWRQRTLGEYGFKVVDGLYSHAALGYLGW